MTIRSLTGYHVDLDWITRLEGIVGGRQTAPIAQVHACAQANHGGRDRLARRVDRGHGHHQWRAPQIVSPVQVRNARPVQGHRTTETIVSQHTLVKHCVKLEWLLHVLNQAGNGLLLNIQGTIDIIARLHARSLARHTAAKLDCLDEIVSFAV